MKEIIKRHQTILGFAGATVAVCIAVVYAFIVPTEAQAAHGFLHIVLAYGHSVSWLLIAIFFACWAARCLPRLRRFVLYSALVVYVLFIATLIVTGSGSTTTASSASNKPQFVFDRAKVPGWWTFGNNWSDPKDADTNTPKDTKWPIADITVHQCKSVAQCSDPQKDTADEHCFVMAFYQDGSIDPKEAIAELIQKNKGWGTTVNEVGTKALTMNTPEGSKQYTLHQLEYDTGNSSTYKGNAQGYIPLHSSHIDVRGICPAANQLDDAVPILNALRLSA